MSGFGWCWELLLVFELALHMLYGEETFTYV